MIAFPLVIGIDPGFDGAVGVLDARGSFVAVHRTGWCGPTMAASTVRWLRVTLGRHNEAGFGADLPAIAIEEPVAMFGGAGYAKSMIAVARSCGVYLGVLAALGAPAPLLVQPRTWQAAIVGKLPRGTKRGARKEHSRDLASRMFGPAFAEAARMPNWKTHEGCAEACLIAEWRRQQLVRERLVGATIPQEAH